MKASQAHAGAPRRTRQKKTYRDGVTVERYRQHRAVTNDVNFLISPHQRHAALQSTSRTSKPAVASLELTHTAPYHSRPFAASILSTMFYIQHCVHSVSLLHV